jgi:hypothetical protein
LNIAAAGASTKISSSTSPSHTTTLSYFSQPYLRIHPNWSCKASTKNYPTSKTKPFLDTSQHAASAAISISSYLSGSTSTTLPSRDFWINAYRCNPETSLMLDMLSNPSLIVKENLEKIHYVYRQPLRSGMIKLHEEMLYIYEHIDFVGNHIKLQIVPAELRNVIFIAFHANPISSHFDLYHTFH